MAASTRLVLFFCVLAAPLGAQRVTLTVSESRTAQVFHVVDQLAEWDGRTHRSYVRWAADSFPLDSVDRAFLARHAALRKARGWDRGVEEAFYTEDDIPTAARHAIARRLLPAREANEEAAILTHFERRLAPMLDSSATRVHAFAERVRTVSDSIQTQIDLLARMNVAKGTRRVPVFLVPNPQAGARGGRFASLRVIVEVPVRPDPLTSLYHELFHALTWTHASRIRTIAASAQLSFDELTEALAYAYAPGIMDDGSDQLAKQFTASTLASPVHRTYETAIRLRPLLRDALSEGESMTSFLTRVERLLRRPPAT